MSADEPFGRHPTPIWNHRNARWTLSSRLKWPPWTLVGHGWESIPSSTSYHLYKGNNIFRPMMVRLTRSTSTSIICVFKAWLEGTVETNPLHHQETEDPPSDLKKGMYIVSPYTSEKETMEGLSVQLSLLLPSSSFHFIR